MTNIFSGSEITARRESPDTIKELAGGDSEIQLKAHDVWHLSRALGEPYLALAHPGAGLGHRHRR